MLYRVACMCQILCDVTSRFSVSRKLYCGYIYVSIAHGGVTTKIGQTNAQSTNPFWSPDKGIFVPNLVKMDLDSGLWTCPSIILGPLWSLESSPWSSPQSRVQVVYCPHQTLIKVATLYGSLWRECFPSNHFILARNRKWCIFRAQKSLNELGV